MRDADPFLRGHLIALLFDLYAVHWRLQSDGANLLKVSSESQYLWPFFARKNGTAQDLPLRSIRRFALNRCPLADSGSFVS
jgi:hypothetical protein